MKPIVTRGAPYEYKDPATGKQYFSNSQVLTVLDPHAFDGIDPFVLAAAQDRGTDLHVLFGLRLLAINGIGAPPQRPTGIIGKYYEGIERFVEERKPRPIKVEESSFNDVLKIAGTLDTNCWLDDDDTLLDLKTGPERAVHSPQLHGYKLLDAYRKAKRLCSLYIRRTGDYKLVEHTHSHVDLAWFQAGLTVLNGRRMHGIH